MTISLHHSLKSRMGRVEESVNWSALAARAFEEKLAEIATRKEKKGMGDVVQRLRVSMMKTFQQESHRGREAGIEWTKENAEASQLINLERYLGDADEHDWGAYFSSDVNNAFSAAELLACVIEGIDNDRVAAERFWQGIIGDDVDVMTDDWVRGFVAGALDLWANVKQQL